MVSAYNKNSRYLGNTPTNNYGNKASKQFNNLVTKPSSVAEQRVPSAPTLSVIDSQYHPIRYEDNAVSGRRKSELDMSYLRSSDSAPEASHAPRGVQHRNNATGNKQYKKSNGFLSSIYQCLTHESDDKYEPYRPYYPSLWSDEPPRCRAEVLISDSAIPANNKEKSIEYDKIVNGIDKKDISNEEDGNKLLIATLRLIPTLGIPKSRSYSSSSSSSSSSSDND